MALNVYGNGTNSSAGANEVTIFYDRAGVVAANRVNVYTQFASKKFMPKRMGKTFKISKYQHMYDRSIGDADFAAKGYMTARTADEVSQSLVSAGLAEGAGDVNQVGLTKITMETTMARYGNIIKYTDEVEMFSEDAMKVRYHMELGELANSVQEDLVQLDMLGTATVMYPGSAISMATIGATQADGSDDSEYTVSHDLITRATRKLLRNRAKKTTQLVAGSTKIDTKTVASAYYAIIGADVKAGLENLTRGVGYEKEYVYIPVHKYSSAASIAEGEVGAMGEVRFIESEGAVVYAGEGSVPPQNYVGNLSITGATDLSSATAADRGNFDVFPILFPTEGSFATVGLKGMGKIKFTSKSPEVVDSSNPYANNGFFAYNFFYAGIILQEEKLLKVLVAANT